MWFNILRVFLAPVSEYALSFSMYVLLQVFHFSLFAPLLWSVLCYLVWCQFLFTVCSFVITRSVC